MRLWTACIRTSENTAQGPAATWGNGMCSSSTYCDICSRWLSHLCVLSRSCLRSSDMCWRPFAVAKWFSVWPDLRRKIKAPRGVIFGMLLCALLCQTSTHPRHVGVGWGLKIALGCASLLSHGIQEVSSWACKLGWFCETAGDSQEENLPFQICEKVKSQSLVIQTHQTRNLCSSSQWCGMFGTHKEKL